MPQLKPKRVFLVHGDPDATAPFAERLRRELGLDVHVPGYRETVQLGTDVDGAWTSLASRCEIRG